MFLFYATSTSLCAAPSILHRPPPCLRHSPPRLPSHLPSCPSTFPFSILSSSSPILPFEQADRLYLTPDESFILAVHSASATIHVIQPSPIPTQGEIPQLAFQWPVIQLPEGSNPDKLDFYPAVSHLTMHCLDGWSDRTLCSVQMLATRQVVLVCEGKGGLELQWQAIEPTEG